MKNVDYEPLVNTHIIEKLKTGTAPWQKPWVPGQPGTSLPYNALTGRRYSGGNILQLWLQDRTDPRWVTFNQALQQGWTVRKGEKGTPIQFWQRVDAKPGEEGADDNDKAEPKKRFIAKIFYVFNVGDQIDGAPPLEPTRLPSPVVAHARLESLVDDVGVRKFHDTRDQAYYRPATDSIHLPARAQFPTLAGYSEVLLHELGHATGHPSRLDRDLSGPFGSESYAREELVAELSSLFAGAQLGIPHNGDSHAAYVGHWIKILQEDHREIFRAASKAAKAVEFVMSQERTWVQSPAMLADEADRLSAGLNLADKKDTATAKAFLTDAAQDLRWERWDEAVDKLKIALGHEAIQQGEAGTDICRFAAKVEENLARRRETPVPPADVEDEAQEQESAKAQSPKARSKSSSREKQKGRARA
jgi:antirestriction protein ArdC